MKNTNNPIMKSVAASAAAMSLATAAFAGETVHVDKRPMPMATASFYNAHELQLGVSALLAARAGQRQRGPRDQGLGLGAALPVRDSDDVLWGADVDLTYFITRNFGIGVEQQWIDDGRPIWNSAVNLVLRAPLNEGSRWAPYLFGGCGIVYAAKHGRFEGHAGAGLEYRFTPKFGTFVDGRYTWVDGRDDALPQYGAFRAGFRFVF